MSASLATAVGSCEVISGVSRLTSREGSGSMGWVRHGPAEHCNEAGESCWHLSSRKLPSARELSPAGKALSGMDVARKPFSCVVVKVSEQKKCKLDPKA